MSIRNLSDGQPRSDYDAVIPIVDGGRYRASLNSYVDPSHDCWYAYWEDGGSDADTDKRDALCLQRIGFDGSMPGIQSVNEVRKVFGNERQIFDMQGRPISSDKNLKGIFIVRENGQTRKVFK